jgi:uncharacterized protein
MPATASPSGRLPIVDILRGWALLAVVLVNFAIFYTLGSPTRIPADDTVSRITKLLVQVFFQSKGWTLLAFLFGYGFSVLIARLRANHPHPTRAFALRMFWLLVIAIANCALYYGDVLKDYVLVGLVILLFQRASAGTALRLSLACLLAFPALIAWSRGLELANPIPEPELALYQSGHLLDVLRYGLQAGLRMSLAVTKYFDWDLVMLACAFAGMYCHRSAYFETIGARRRQLRWLCLGALAFAILSAGLRAADSNLGWNLLAHYDIGMWFLLGQMVCFTAAICWLYVAGRGLRLFEWMRQAGRMTLTNYMAQNLLGMLIFSGFGLGLLHRIPYSVHIALAVGVFAAQVVFSRWWLATHRLGPVEWLWRRLAALGPQPTAPLPQQN